MSWLVKSILAQTNLGSGELTTTTNKGSTTTTRNTSGRTSSTTEGPAPATKSVRTVEPTKATTTETFLTPEARKNHSVTQRQTGAVTRTSSENAVTTLTTTSRPTTTTQVTESAVGTSQTSTEDRGAMVSFSITLKGKVPSQPLP